MRFLKTQNFNPLRAKILHTPAGESKGVGFVQLHSTTEAKEAIKLLHQTELSGRTLVVNMARTQEVC